MTALTQEILNNFDRLSNSEQLQIAMEILKRLIIDFFEWNTYYEMLSATQVNAA
jgi:hypothetical protein